MPLITTAAATADELAALAWTFDATAVVVDGPTVLDLVPDEHRAVVAGSLLCTLATKGLVDLAVEDAGPRLRPTPTWPSLPAQLTEPDRWLRFRRADDHGVRTRHLLAHEGRWIVVDVIGGLLVLAPCERQDLHDLAAIVLAPDDVVDVDVDGDGAVDADRPAVTVADPPRLGFRSDLWSCAAADGAPTGSWRRWQQQLAGRTVTAVDVDLFARTGPDRTERSWFTVLAADGRGWIAGPDPDGTVAEPSDLAGGEAPSCTEALAPATFGAVLEGWLPAPVASGAPADPQ